ncbi:hypothetical protein Droror1_Dr00025085, partial [Drosera rotundifolia]
MPVRGCLGQCEVDPIKWRVCSIGEVGCPGNSSGRPPRRGEEEEEKRERIEAERDLSSIEVSQAAAIAKLKMSIDEVVHLWRELEVVDKKAEDAKDDGFNKGIES